MFAGFSLRSDKSNNNEGTPVYNTAVNVSGGNSKRKNIQTPKDKMGTTNLWDRNSHNQYLSSRISILILKSNVTLYYVKYNYNIAIHIYRIMLDN